jgi:phage repressor protein C with HTH and peptisase S24 domain
LSADRDAYALTVVGNSMLPRFRPGRRIAVSPKSPVAIGDDVVVRLRSRTKATGEEAALIKELVRRTNDTIELRQFNPDLTFSVDASEVDAIHKIAGELI